MCLGIYRETVNGVLDLKLFDLLIMIRIVLVENRNGTAVARGVDSPKARIELDDIRPISEGKKCYGLMLSRSKTVIRLFSSHDKNARWCFGSSVMP